jgi:hypothetical protein
MDAYRVVRRRGFHISLTIGSQMAMRLSALRLPPFVLQEDSRYLFLLETEYTPGQ